MAKPRQSSFRRILLSRLLLLSIPVLLTGEIVAYRKARSGLLETAQRNITESAARKGESLQSTIASLRSNLATAAEASVFQSSSPARMQEFLKQLQQSSAIPIQCIQLVNLQAQRLEASTCGNLSIRSFSGAAQDLPSSWTAKRSGWLPDPKTVQLSLAQSPQTNLVLSAPVYAAGAGGQLRYALSVQTDLYQQQGTTIHGLSDYTVIVDQAGQILTSTIADPARQPIQSADAERLRSFIRTAIANQQNSPDSFSFQQNGVEWLAGYRPVKIAVNGAQTQTWIILAATPLNDALSSLEGIQQILFILTLGLLIAILLATLFLARELALPIERLNDYALQIRQRGSADRAPKNFKVRELNHLAEALDNMVERLEERAEELESAWQEAQAANQLKSEFLATTSHELRTPLNAIIGCVRLVRDGCCDDREEELEFLQQADDAALHLLKIINDLLDIAKIEAGKVELNLQLIQIQELCRQCLKMVQPGAEMKRLKLSLVLDDRSDPVLLDERRVRQMVINLLSNAIKFTPEGGQVKLSVTLSYGHQLEKDTRPDHSPINPNTPYLCLEVEDSGIGIPEDRWHLLFRPFQQIDSSMTRRHEGTGLGLALTKRLVELHGGTLSFKSVTGKGSRFRIWLPLLESENSLGSLPLIDPLVSSHQSNRVDPAPIDRLSISNG